LFFLRSLQQQVRQLARRVERETLMQSALPELSARILDTVRDHGRISVGDMVRLTGASRNTLKEHFRRLVEKDHLVRRGGGRGVWYSLK
jgi:DNA-binding MarR family transcriptional regulator